MTSAASANTNKLPFSMDSKGGAQVARPIEAHHQHHCCECILIYSWSIDGCVTGWWEREGGGHHQRLEMLLSKYISVASWIGCWWLGFLPLHSKWQYLIWRCSWCCCCSPLYVHYYMWSILLMVLQHRPDRPFLPLRLITQSFIIIEFCCCFDWKIATWMSQVL